VAEIARAPAAGLGARKFRCRPVLETPNLGNLELVRILVLSESLNGEALKVRDDFKNEVFSSFDPNPVPACSQCGKKPAQVRSMLDPVRGRMVRMFKCECGEQTWSEDK